jgi:Abnormal spindle-like microcephaly-assoc'd, ASPM-SPD-2-Hydin
MALDCPGRELVTSSLERAFCAKMRPFGEAAGGTYMVGGLWTCVHSKRAAGVILVLSAILLVAVPAASRVSQTGYRTRTEPAHSAGANLMQVTPDAVSFVDVPAGDTYTQTVRITNTSEGTFQIKRITASRADFLITDVILPVVVAPGTSETFTVSYRARAARAEAQIRIVTSSSETPFVLNVRASAVEEQGELTASEAGIDFNDVAVGSSSRKEVLLMNSGNGALRISDVSVSGADFALSGAGAATLSPGQNISLDVSFAPKSAGKRAGSLKVLSAQGESLLEIPLSAAGVAPSQNVVKLNWEESPSSVAGYVIYRSADPSGPYMRLSSQAVPSAEYVDTGLAAGHTYYYVVTSVGADEVESEYSAPIRATVPEA